MTTKEQLFRELEHIPEFLLEEVLDFVQFLRSKKIKESVETYILSESSLKKDWLSKEEEEAWRNL